MNILHLNSNYNRSSIYRNMVKQFRTDLSDDGKVYFSTYNNYLPDSSEVHYLDVRNKVKKIDFLFSKMRNKKLYHDLSSIYSMNNFNITLAYSLFSNGMLAYEINRMLGIPYTVIVQNTDVNFHFKKVPFSKKKGNLILDNASKIIFISEPYKEEVIKKFVVNKDSIRKKSFVIPFGIDRFWKDNAVSNSKKINSKEVNLLFVGKVNKNKNILSIVKVLSSLKADGYKVKLNIVGEIENQKIYKKFKRNEDVNWLPFVEEKEKLLEVYRNNDIFIMPSYKESFGLVYGEAMSQGLPVIYTKGQGFDGHFEDGQIGYSVSPDNIKEIKQKIINIIDNYDNISYNCINSADRFYWENIIEEYKGVLRDYLN